MEKIKIVSLFKSLKEKGEDQKLADILNQIKNGSIQNELILKIRDLEKNNKDYSGLKKNLESFTPGGTFHPSHKATDLKEYSRVIVLDIDNLGIRKIVQIKKAATECLYTKAVFVSPSGKGLKILVEVDTEAELHNVAYEQVVNFYEDLLEIKIDRSGSDVSRLCFISYDPELYYNEDSNVFKIVDVFYAKYQSAVTKTMGKHQYKEGQRNYFVHFLANNCNRLGIPKKITETLILKDYNYNQKEVLASIKSAYSNVSEAKQTKDSKWDKIEAFLKRNYDFMFNEFSGAIEFRKRSQNGYAPLTDYDGNSILRNLQLNGQSVSKDRLYTILLSDFNARYNPIREYIESLDAWDGETDFIGQLAKRVSTDDNEFFIDAFKRWFVAMVASGLHDSLINQTAIIFSGKQGLGKSTFIRNLLPESLESIAMLA